MISFIIPAYNEESLLGRTLRALRYSAGEALQGQLYEVIVVDDASTDRTSQIAEEQGARVVAVNKRHIAAVRNAGAREAQGDIFIFIDADTIVSPAVLGAALDALQTKGAVGGGSRVAMDGRIGFWGWLYFELFLFFWRPLRLAAECFIFVRREDFVAVGGFDERYFASEEVWMSLALKKRGRFVILKEKVITSGRKARLYGSRPLFLLGLRFLVYGPKAWRKRKGLELWYDGKREAPSELDA